MADEQPGSIGKALDEMPWWVKAVALIGNTFGIPTVLIGFYLAQDAGMIKNPVADELQEIKGITLQHDASMRELVKAVEEQGRQMADEAKNRQMRCVLRAKTEDEKRACFPNGKE